MKVLICGSRNLVPSHALLDRLIKKLEDSTGREVTEIIEGSATGVDRRAGEYAKLHGYNLTEVNADWNKYGRAAGPIRNSKMVEMCDAAIAIVVHAQPSVDRGTRTTFG
jgi:hypothetical protein